MCIPQNGLHIEVGFVLGQDKVFDIDQANDIVRIVLIYRESGVHGFTESGQNIIKSSIHIHCDHIDLGNHDIFGQRIREIKHIIDHFFLFGFNYAIFVAHVHNGTKLVLSHGIIFRVRVDTKQKQHSTR